MMIKRQNTLLIPFVCNTMRSQMKKKNINKIYTFILWIAWIAIIGHYWCETVSIFILEVIYSSFHQWMETVNSEHTRTSNFIGFIVKEWYQMNHAHTIYDSHNFFSFWFKRIMWIVCKEIELLNVNTIIITQTKMHFVNYQFKFTIVYICFLILYFFTFSIDY